MCLSLSLAHACPARSARAPPGVQVALSTLQCRRRVLLTGTPMQNDLNEFYAMVDFTNPDLLGDARKFNKHYQRPILIGRKTTEPFSAVR